MGQNEVSNNQIPNGYSENQQLLNSQTFNCATLWSWGGSAVCPPANLNDTAAFPSALVLIL